MSSTTASTSCSYATTTAFSSSTSRRNRMSSSSSSGDLIFSRRRGRGRGRSEEGERKKGDCRYHRCAASSSSSSSSSSSGRKVSAATAFENAQTSVSIDWNSQIRKAEDERVGVLLLNLGGPETLDDVEPFLFNLFADPDIIRLPSTFVV